MLVCGILWRKSMGSNHVWYWMKVVIPHQWHLMLLMSMNLLYTQPCPVITASSMIFYFCYIFGTVCMNKLLGCSQLSSWSSNTFIISGLPCGLNDIFAVLGCNAALIGSHRRFRTGRQSHLQASEKVKQAIWINGSLQHKVLRCRDCSQGTTRRLKK